MKTGKGERSKNVNYQCFCVFISIIFFWGKIGKKMTIKHLGLVSGVWYLF